MKSFVIETSYSGVKWYALAVTYKTLKDAKKSAIDFHRESIKQNKPVHFRIVEQKIHNL